MNRLICGCSLDGFLLQAMEIVRRLLRICGGGEDRPLIGLEHVQPMAEIADDAKNYAPGSDNAELRHKNLPAVNFSLGYADKSPSSSTACPEFKHYGRVLVL